MTKATLIVVSAIATIATLMAGCASGPRCYGNSIYDNNIYNFYMNGKENGKRLQAHHIGSRRMVSDWNSGCVEFRTVSYKIMP